MNYQQKRFLINVSTLKNMKRILFFVAIVAILALCFTSCRTLKEGCPMHYGYRGY